MKQGTVLISAITRFVICFLFQVRELRNSQELEQGHRPPTIEDRPSRSDKDLAGCAIRIDKEIPWRYTATVIGSMMSVSC